ncbi:hypothetical protein AnigIFM63309_004586 [Aspergillus niger]|nr:hypothetical protein AnigIFM63309_004586 [Aspergillus niger]
MKLDHLPVELILQIVPFLTKHDYAQLVLVCKSWYSLFISHLYHHVVLPLNHYCGFGYGHKRYSKDLPVRRFTLALLENPTLAPLIHFLQLYPSYCEGKWQDRPPLKPVAEEKYLPFMLPYGDAKRKHRRKFHAWRRDLRHRSERQDWYRKYRFEDAWLALLMVQVKNLETFAIQLPEEWDHIVDEGEPLLKNSVHFERVIQWASNPKLGILTYLKHISLRDGPDFWEYRTSVGAVPMNRLLPYLRIPSLRKLYVHNVCDRSRFHMPKSLVLPLTHLDLMANDDDLPNLPSLLERCPSLQSFTLEVGDGTVNHTHQYLNHSRLYQPLRRSQSSLRYLNLIFLSDRTWQDAEIPSPVFFGSLTEFRNLQTIHMRWSSLLPFLGSGSYDPEKSLRELLPCSLQYLFIHDCLIQSSLALCRELETLEIHYFEAVPLLKALYLEYAVREQAPGQGCMKCVSGHWSNYRMMETDPVIDRRLLDLQGKFRTLGVDFRIIKPGVTAKPFPLDGAIRTKWPWETFDGVLM